MSNSIKIRDDNYCPVCGEHIDGVSAYNEEDYFTPQTGDVSICSSCTAFLVFDEDLMSRILTPDELLTLPDNVLEQLSYMRHQLNIFNEYKAQQSKDEEEN